MKFFSKLVFALNPKIKKLENQAHDVLELPGDVKAFRVDDDIIVVDYGKNKIVDQFNDVYPSNPARATFQIMKKLKLASNYQDFRKALDKKEAKEKQIWTCGFRSDENRWVWYRNSMPHMTVSFQEMYPDLNENLDSVEKKIDFCSAKFGTTIVSRIETDGIENVGKDLNALILENPYTEIKCSNCECSENYTIDDLVDENKKAKYDSNFVICNNCEQLIKLV